MITVCEKNKCSGCMGCINVCGRNAITIKDDSSYYNAYIDEELCVNCKRCTNICSREKFPDLIHPKYWYQGWAQENIRKDSSSGGAAATIAKTFIKNGGAVCSCIFDHGEFIFDFAEKESDIEKFQGSKYVKSNPGYIYRQIRERLTSQNILFIGLPCQVAALKNIIGNKNSDRLFTIDLICHGTPSPKILMRFLEENNIRTDTLKNISFRENNYFRVSTDQGNIVPKGVRDRYTYGFLKGLFYTEGCYECHYARLERVGDISLGDSWGSEIDDKEKSKGVSLILVQTEKGKLLVDSADLKTMDVDLHSAQEANHQLKAPFTMPEERKRFFDVLENENVMRAIFKCYPKLCLKQDIKSEMIKFGLIKK